MGPKIHMFCGFTLRTTLLCYGNPERAPFPTLEAARIQPSTKES